MSAVSKTFITTDDTKKTYVYPPEKGTTNPTLWAIGYAIGHVSEHGQAYVDLRNQQKLIHVERQTLVNCGLLPQCEDDEPKPAPPETVEDLILRLLDKVGVHPAE